MQSDNKKEVLIIGGGISGLTCAWHLSEAGFKVTLLEKEYILGGLARSFLIDGNWVPLTYHHVMAPDKTTLTYIKKFGFYDQLRWVRSPQILWYENKSYLVTPLGVLSFKGLDLLDKLRLFYLGIYAWFKKDWDNLKDVDCDEWLKRIAGDRNTDVIFKNLMDMKFNMPLSSVSAAWLGERMHQAVRNQDMYGYPNGGWQGLFNRMADEITKMEGRIITNFEVTKISGNTVSGRYSDGKDASFSSDNIVSTIPPISLDAILDSDEKKKEPLKEIKYKSFICLVIGSKDNISGEYWSVILKPHLIFGGVFNFTRLSGFRDKDGNSIYYLFTYLDHDDPLFTCDDEKLAALYAKDLRNIFPKVSLNWYKIFRFKYSQPVFRRGYHNLPIEFSSNLYLAGVYRRYPNPRTMDSAFAGGEETARYIIKKYESR